MKVFLSPLNRTSIRVALAAAVLAVGLLGMTGCKSKQDAAIEQAKQQAASTGQAQQVVYTDADGNTVTTTVQPPVPGQSGQVVTTVVTPKGASPDAAPVQAADATPAPAATTAAPAASAPAAAPRPKILPPTEKPPAAVSTPVVKPVPPPPPDVHIAAGTALAVRIDQRISAKASNPGETFTGELAQPVVIGGETVIPKGANVAGVIDAAKGRGNFKGAASLALSLTSITVRGRTYPLSTADLTRSEKGKGKRTGAFIGGGAGLGALIGGLAGGGKGALIGGLAGAGAGTAGAGLTGNGDLVIPAETVVQFTLADELVVRP